MSVNVKQFECDRCGERGFSVAEDGIFPYPDGWIRSVSHNEGLVYLCDECTKLYKQMMIEFMSK